MRDHFQLAFGDPTKELLPAGALRDDRRHLNHVSLYKFNESCRSKDLSAMHARTGWPRGKAKGADNGPSEVDMLSSVVAQGGTGVPPVSDETEKTGGTPVPLFRLPL